MTPDLDGRAIAAGAGLALAISVPAALAAHALDAGGKVDDDSSLLLLFVGVIIFGMAAGGYVAATRRLDTPLTHSAAAATAAYVLVQGVGLVRRLLADEPVTWVALPFFALLSAAAGMAGGLVAERRARRPRRPRHITSGTGADAADTGSAHT